MAKDNNYYLDKYKKAAKKKEPAVKPELNAAANKGAQNKDAARMKFEKIETGSKPVQKFSKKQLTAVYSVLIGADSASKILMHLNDEEIRIIIREIIKLKEIRKDDIREVERNFGSIDHDRTMEYSGGEKYAQILLQKIYGMEKGSSVYIRIIEEDSSGNFFNLLNRLPEKSIIDVLNDESDMVVSIIFSLMDSKKVAGILNYMPRDKALKIIKRMSRKIEIQPQILNTIVAKLKEKVSAVEPEDMIKIHGKNKLVDILKHTSLENAAGILESLEEVSPDLAGELKDSLFTFGDIAAIPKKSLDYALKDYNDREIAYILKGASDDVKNAVFGSVTKRRRLYIEDEMKILGRVKKSDVDEKRKGFIDYLKMLEGKSKINLSIDNELYVE